MTCHKLLNLIFNLMEVKLCFQGAHEASEIGEFSRNDTEFPN